MTRRFQATLLLLTVAIASMAPGCDKLRPRAPSATSKPGQEAPTEPVSTNNPRSLGADADDDPRAPACLPPTQPNGEWVKTEPVRVFAAAQLDKVLPAEQARRCAEFRIKSAARCAYDLKRADGKPSAANVAYVETLTVEDAYGLLTCLSQSVTAADRSRLGGSAETYRIGGETRVEHEGGLSLHCWQGKCYLSVSSTQSDPDTTEQMIRLLMHVCGKIAHEEPPSILGSFPPEGRRRLWLARHLSSLPPAALELGPAMDVPRVSALLGLGKDTLICVAAYDVPQAQRPDVVFVVEYPTIKPAHDAYARYARLIHQGTEPIAVSASVLPAQSAFLVGTWTAEEESMLYVLPRIAKLLPQ